MNTNRTARTNSTARTNRTARTNSTHIVRRAIAAVAVAGVGVGSLASVAGAATNHPPVGVVASIARTSATTGRIGGWSKDPDVPALPTAVEVWVGNRLAATGTANVGADGHHFDLSFGTDSREHQVCVIGIGRGAPVQRIQLGCANLAAVAAPAPAPAPTPQPTTPKPTVPTPPTLPCRSNVTLFMPVSMDMVRPPLTTCFSWAHISQPSKGNGFSTRAIVSDRMAEKQPWTFEDINSGNPAATTKAQVSIINSSAAPGHRGFVQMAVRSSAPTPLDRLGISNKVDYIPAIQVYGPGATGTISSPGPLAFAVSQIPKGALPIFRITPANLTAANIATIASACVTFHGRIGIWTGTGAYPDRSTQPAAFAAAVASMTPKVKALYRAIDRCNQTLGSKSAPSAGL